MQNGDQSAAIFKFGLFELSRRTGELRKGDTVIRLSPQPIRVLTLLVERAGEVVTRDEIQQDTWTRDTTVDFELGLNRCIRRIRAVLNDDAETPRYIETVPRVGYRFIAPVKIGEPPSKAPKSKPIPAEILPPFEPPPVVAPSSRKRVTNHIWILTAIVCLIVVLAMLGWRWASFTTSGIRLAYTVVPLETEPGFASSPTFSPDGRQIAFSWNGKKQDNFDIYVKIVGSFEELRLTDTPEIEFSPSWSPDGRFIAFCRGTDLGGTSLWIISPLGGAAKKIVDLGGPAAMDARRIAWSRNSQRLVFADTNGLFEIDVQNGTQRQITSTSGTQTDTHPAYSPDGRSLAFTRDIGNGISGIQVLQVNEDGTPEGDPSPLRWPGFESVYSASPVWTPDSRQIIFASNRTGEHQLWIANTHHSSADPQLLVSLGTNIVDAALSTTGRLALVREHVDTDLWKLNLASLLKSGSANLEPIANSTRVETNPKVSPDGKKIAFESNRAGFTEVWTANVDGSNPLPLTAMQNPGTGSPVWSHDGRRIAFESRADSGPRIYVMPSDGGTPLPLTQISDKGVVPAWSGDDKWILFTSDKTGKLEIWRIPSRGGAAEQVTHNGAYAPVASPDGKFLYYAANRSALTELRALDLTTGKETAVASNVGRRNYFPTGRQIFYISGGSKQMLMVADPPNGTARKLFQFEKPVGEGIAISPDSTYLFFGQVDRGGSDLMQVEDFWK